MFGPLEPNRQPRYEPRPAYGETVNYFHPGSLPPDPPTDLTPLQQLLEETNQAVGRLDGVSVVLPDPGLFLYSYVRKEALLSSQIEGTQSSLSELLLFEHADAPGVPLDDVVEVSNYVNALAHGLDRLREGFPLSVRLIREIHGVLLAKGRGADKQPGEFRTTQNWIGGTRPGNAAFVPPPPEAVPLYMAELEKFLHDDNPSLPLLVRAAMAQVQFESIHPFLDGNGRLGRLLVTFLLCTNRVLREPLLYSSLHLKQHRDDYYRLMMEVRSSNRWRPWIEFFLTGIRDTAESAVSTARRIQLLHERSRARLLGLGRATPTALRLFDEFQRNPLYTIGAAVKATGLSFPTVSQAMQKMTGTGVVREISGRRRGQVFVYDDYLNILNEGMEPLSRAA